MTKAKEEWEKERSMLNKRIADLSSNSAAEADLLKGDLSRFKSQSKALQDDLEKKSNEVKKLNGIASDLKGQIDELRKELEANAAAAKKKLESELAKMKAHYDGLMGKNDAGNAEMMMKLEMKAKEDLDKALEALRTGLQAVIDEEEEAHKKTDGRLSGELASERDAHKQTLDNLSAQIAEMKAKYESGHADMVKAHDAEMAKVKQALKDEHDAHVRDAKEAHEKERKLLADNHSLEKDKLGQEAKDAMNEAMRKAAEGELKKLREADEKLKAELEKLEKELRDSHSVELDSAKGQLQTVVDELRQELSSIREGLGGETKVREERDREIATLKLNIQSLKDSHSATMRQESEERRMEVESLNLAHSNASSFAAEQHREALAAAEATRLSERAAFESEVSTLKSEMEQMHERWLARESRPEDIERIQSLEREMVEKDALVQKTREEMSYFKRELLNREENFNKKFNTNPNVGVMSVIKPKDGGAGGKDKKQRRRSTQLPPPPGAKGGLGGINGNGSSNAKENRRASGPVFGL